MFLVSVSLSGAAAGIVLYTALLFLQAGAMIGGGGLCSVGVGPTDPLVVTFADKSR